MSRTATPLPPAFAPRWSADQFADAADARLRLGSAALARFALAPSANRTAAASSAVRRRMCGGYAPSAALPLFRVRG